MIRFLKETFRYLLLKHFYRGRLTKVIKKPKEINTESLWNSLDLHYLDPANSYDWTIYSNQNNRGVFSWDYPVLYWMKQTFKENISVLDYGGALGQTFLAYDRYLNILKWHCLDLEQVVKQIPYHILAEKRFKAFAFKDFSAEKKFDFLLASSSIQYDLRELNEIIRGLIKYSNHIIINRTPFSSHCSFYALQSISKKLNHNIQVFNLDEMIEVFSMHNYKLVDLWTDNLDNGNRIPFTNKEVIYKGVYFKKCG